MTQGWTETSIEYISRLEHEKRQLLDALNYAYRKLHNFVVVHGDDVFAEAWKTGGKKILAAIREAEKL